MENINENLIRCLQEEIMILKEQKRKVKEYLDSIDDRNSIKLQLFKSNVENILEERPKVLRKCNNASKKN